VGHYPLFSCAAGEPLRKSPAQTVGLRQNPLERSYVRVAGALPVPADLSRREMAGPLQDVIEEAEAAAREGVEVRSARQAESRVGRE